MQSVVYALRQCFTSVLSAAIEFEIKDMDEEDGFSYEAVAVSVTETMNTKYNTNEYKDIIINNYRKCLFGINPYRHDTDGDFYINGDDVFDLIYSCNAFKKYRDVVFDDE